MAKFECTITGDFDAVLQRLHNGILSGSASATYEDGSDYAAGDVRCAVRVYLLFFSSLANYFSSLGYGSRNAWKWRIGRLWPQTIRMLGMDSRSSYRALTAAMT